MRASRHFDTIVIGGGIIGCSTFYQLSKVLKGNVLLIDKGRIGSGGATKNTGAIFRVFDPDPVITDLAASSLEDYYFFEEKTGIKNPFFARKLIYNLKCTRDQTSALLKNSEVDLHWVQMKSARDLKECFHFHPEANLVEDSRAGFLDPQQTAQNYVRAALGNGAVVSENDAVQSFQGDGTMINCVVTNKEVYTCTKVIVACGADGLDLLTSELHETSFRSKLIQYLLADVSWQVDPPNMPIIIDEVSQFYLKPISGNRFLLGKVIDQWDLDLNNLPDYSDEEEKTVISYFKDSIPSVENIVVDSKVVGYDLFTNSRLGKVEVSEIFKNCVVATGWSGQGFKVAPEVGRRVSQLSINL